MELPTSSLQYAVPDNESVIRHPFPAPKYLSFISSHIWDELRLLPNDIVVNTYSRSGTTLTIQIVDHLLNQGVDRESKNIHKLAIWVEDLSNCSIEKMLAIVDGLPKEKPRIIKSHLPITAITYYPQCRYIYIARNGLDVLLSFYNFINAMDETFRLKWIGERVALDGLFDEWIKKDGSPLWSYFYHVQSWFDHRHLPNLLLLRFEEITCDYAGTVDRLAEFLNVAIVSEEEKKKIVNNCSFNNMKSNANKFKLFNVVKAECFVFKGEVGRFRKEFNQQQIDEYLATAKKILTKECFDWVHKGVFDEE